MYYYYYSALERENLWWLEEKKSLFRIIGYRYIICAYIKVIKIRQRRFSLAADSFGEGKIEKNKNLNYMAPTKVSRSLIILGDSDDFYLKFMNPQLPMLILLLLTHWSVVWSILMKNLFSIKQSWRNKH